MTPIEPGETFTVGYGKGHTIEVVALSLRAKLKVARMFVEMQSLPDEIEGQEKQLAICDEMLAICAPNMTDTQAQTLDEVLALEVVQRTVSLASIGNEQKKS